MKPANQRRDEPVVISTGRSEFEIVVYPRHIEITERYTQSEVEQLIEQLRNLGVKCELVFKSPCG